jgi:DNA polymerase-4
MDPLRWIIHIDMDAFFVAVEQRENPSLKGKCVIVGGAKGKRGVVCSASYEARKYGIRAGMAITEATRRCPQGIFIQVRGSLYSSVSHQIMDIFQEYSPLVEQVSVDEAFLDLTGTERLFGSPIETARTIQERIEKELHLSCSVGVASTKLLAKIASDLKKPHGFVVIPHRKEWEFLAPLPVKVLWGVGEKTEETITKLGIHTVGQLASLSSETLTSLFGKSGVHLYALAHGDDGREVTPYTPPKSFGHETTFEQDQSDPDILASTLLSLCDKVAWRMRRQPAKGKTVTLKIRYPDFSTHTSSQSLPEYIDQSGPLYEVIQILWKRHYQQGRPVRLLGVSVSNLADEIEQLALFSETAKKESMLVNAVDELNEKFQGKAVTRATLKLSPKKKPGTLYKE